MLAAAALAVATLPAARFFIVNLPSLWFDGRIVADVLFDRASGQRLDLYIPADASPDAPAPAILFFHGGSWREGAKSQYRFLGATLAERGYLVAIADYRKFPEARFPEFMADAAAAVVWTAREIVSYGGDPDRLFLMGHSAGGHIAVLLASDARYLVEAGGEPEMIRGVAGLAGPYDFTPEAPDIVEIFGPPERYPQMQTSRFVDGDEPPLLMMYGLADDVVGPQNLERMAAALDAVDGCYQAVRYPGVDHIAIIAAFTWLYDSRPMLDDMLGFFERAADGAACG